MKKLLYLFLALIMILSLVACGGNTDGDEGNLMDDYAAENLQGDSTDESSYESKPGSLLEKQVLVDVYDCEVTLLGMWPNESGGYDLDVHIENSSKDTDYEIHLSELTVEGIAGAGDFGRHTVAAGETLIETIKLIDEVLLDSGVTSCTDVELTFWCRPVGGHYTDVATETVRLYPFGEEKATKFVREAQPTDIVLIDNDVATVVVTKLGVNDNKNRFERYGGYTSYDVILYAVNKTDVDLSINTGDAYLNGVICDPHFGMTVPVGEVCFHDMSWSKDTLEEVGLSELDIKEIQFELIVEDVDVWGENFLKEVFTLKP